MADNTTFQTTPATPPAGLVIATDDAGAGGHVQIVKLALGTDGSATPITADANGLEVQGAGVAGTPAGGVVSVQGVASGTDLPVSVSTALPAGTNAIGKLSANSGVDIGDVDVTSIVGAGTLGVNQVSVAATATLIVAARTGRRAVSVINHSAVNIFLGNSASVTVSNGALLLGTVGTAVSFEYSGDVYGISTSGSNVVSYVEEY